jgi:hypothetical protein
VPVVYSLNTEFQLCNNEKVFLMDPNTSDMSLAEMDYKGAFSKGELLLHLQKEALPGHENLLGKSLDRTSISPHKDLSQLHSEISLGQPRSVKVKSKNRVFIFLHVIAL